MTLRGNYTACVWRMTKSPHPVNVVVAFVHQCFRTRLSQISVLTPIFAANCGYLQDFRFSRILFPLIVIRPERTGRRILTIRLMLVPVSFSICRETARLVKTIGFGQMGFNGIPLVVKTGLALRSDSGHSETSFNIK